MAASFHFGMSVKIHEVKSRIPSMDLLGKLPFLECWELELCNLFVFGLALQSTFQPFILFLNGFLAIIRI